MALTAPPRGRRRRRAASTTACTRATRLGSVPSDLDRRRATARWCSTPISQPARPRRSRSPGRGRATTMTPAPAAVAWATSAGEPRRGRRCGHQPRGPARAGADGLRDGTSSAVGMVDIDARAHDHSPDPTARPGGALTGTGPRPRARSGGLDATVSGPTRSARRVGRRGRRSPGRSGHRWRTLRATGRRTCRHRRPARRSGAPRPGGGLRAGHRPRACGGTSTTVAPPARWIAAHARAPRTAGGGCRSARRRPAPAGRPRPPGRPAAGAAGARRRRRAAPAARPAPAGAGQPMRAERAATRRCGRRLRPSRSAAAWGGGRRAPAAGPEQRRPPRPPAGPRW